MPGPRNKHPDTLLVEGTNDREFIYALTNRAGIARGTYKVHDWEEGSGGFETLVDSLPGFFVGSEVARLGIVVDADDNPTAHWQAVISRLRNEGYNLPPEPVVGGLVHQESGKRIIVGIWLMPDNRQRGMLEDLAFQIMPSGDSLWPYAVDAVERISRFEQRFRPTYMMKAQLHTWLAWQDEPGTQLGLAIKRGYLKDDAPLAAEFVHWLRRLFFL